ncbi:hypothetical protein K0M31_007841 [Melipona bicolor]|uniref:Uncharacterized protein n=1 Tax=Melipona bicolor TaxID=60889 RepID=A0AA40GCF7_9HYME|nr:hypothetical protein K0M31_007841 [Melipona bicolor]
MRHGRGWSSFGEIYLSLIELPPASNTGKSTRSEKVGTMRRAGRTEDGKVQTLGGFLVLAPTLSGAEDEVTRSKPVLSNFSPRRPANNADADDAAVAEDR